MKNEYIIYLILNMVTWQCYIGKTLKRRFKTRMRNHKYAKNGCPRLQNAIRYYGWESFEVYILHEGVHPDDVDALEMQDIIEYDTKHPAGYNLTDGGEGAIGYKHHKESRMKMSKKRQERKNQPMQGKHHSKETKKRFSKMFSGEGGSCYGKPAPNRHWAWTYASDIADMYLIHQLSSREISILFGCDNKVVLRILNKYGIKSRPVGGQTYLRSSIVEQPPFKR